MLALPVLAAASTLWTVDPSAFVLEPGAWAVRSSVECPADAVLGVAVVVYSRKQLTMAWGHSSVRIRTCADGVPVDREYETYRLGRWNRRMLALEHAGEAFLQDEAYLDRQRGALVLFRTPDPVDAGWYAEAQDRNREIYELWLELPPAELDAIHAAAEGWYADQRAALRARRDLTERYVPWTVNCTTVLKRLVPPRLQVASALPFRWLRALEEGGGARVLHPSRHLWHTWRGVAPEVTTRPRPVFRARGGPRVDP